MEQLQTGDLVVLTAGSMRMAVESVEGDAVACVWCHEGQIGRDTFNAKLLKKWEHREDDRPVRSAAPRGPRADRDFSDKPSRAPRGERDDKPRAKPGWDGKPREKKFFRKD